MKTSIYSVLQQMCDVYIQHLTLEMDVVRIEALSLSKKQAELKKIKKPVVLNQNYFNSPSALLIRSAKLNKIHGHLLTYITDLERWEKDGARLDRRDDAISREDEVIVLRHMMRTSFFRNCKEHLAVMQLQIDNCTAQLKKLKS